MQILSCFLSTFVYLLPVCCFLPVQLKNRQIFCLFLMQFISILLIGFVFGNVSAVFLLLSTCIYIAYIDSNWLFNSCIYIASYLFFVILDNIYFIVWDVFFNPIADFLSNPLNYLIYAISYSLLIFCICLITGHFLRPVLRRIESSVSGHLLLLIAVSLGACLFVCIFNIVMGEQVGYSSKVVAFNCILLICYFTVSSILIVNIVKIHMEKLNMDMRQDSYDRLQEYTNQIEDMYSSLRSFKHDYSNIMLSMSGYIELGDMEGLKYYFEREILPLSQDITKTTAHFNQLMNIKPAELKSIVSSKLLYAAERNIHVSIEVMDEVEDIPVDMIDLSRMIGNFLDNAIEAAIESASPSIRFALIHLDSQYIFIISNSFLDRGLSCASLAKPDVSTKGPNRGLGLYNVHKIIEKYNYIFLDTEIRDGAFVQRLQIFQPDLQIIGAAC